MPPRASQHTAPAQVVETEPKQRVLQRGVLGGLRCHKTVHNVGCAPVVYAGPAARPEQRLVSPGDGQRGLNEIVV